MANFKVGDTVVLKSDPSVHMTVGTQPDAHGLVKCHYFIDRTFTTCTIPQEALNAVESEPPTNG